MKRNFGSLAVLVAALAFVVMAPAFAAADGAIVIRPGFCGLRDGNGDPAEATDNIAIGTSSRNCNATLSCKVKGVPNDTGKAVHWDFDTTPTACGVVIGDITYFTEQWHEIVSKSGVAHLICHVNTCPD